MLKEMSLQYESGKYDLWHQFSVINPLRFLGLIPDSPSETKQDENEDAYYELNTDKICRYLDKLNAVADGAETYSDWWNYASISEKEDFENTNLKSQITSLKDGFSDPAVYRIYTSEVMMKRKDINIGCL